MLRRSNVATHHTDGRQGVKKQDLGCERSLGIEERADDRHHLIYGVEHEEVAAPGNDEQPVVGDQEGNDA